MRTADIWSTTWPRRRMLISVSRRRRLAWAEVRRSSQRCTGRENCLRRSPAKVRTFSAWAPGVPLSGSGSPTTISQTLYWLTTSDRCCKSERLFLRCRVGNPWADTPRGSETASPMRRAPKSRARIRPRSNGGAVLSSDTWRLEVRGQAASEYHNGMSSEPVELDSAQERELERPAVVTVPRARGEKSNVALSVIALILVLAACYFAKPVFVVLLVSILIAFLLAPVADLLERFRIPRPIASLISVLLMAGVLYGFTYYSYSAASQFVRDLPKYSAKM